MQRKRLAFIIAFGPEIRSFLHSGLLNRLTEQHDITIFAFRPASSVFQKLPDSVRIIPLPPESEPDLLRKWRYRASFLHNLWLENRGNRHWRHYLQSSKVNPLKHRLLAALAWKGNVQFMSILEDILARKMGTNAIWGKLYDQFGIGAVITSSYASERTLPALQTAANLGLKTVIVTNSWKDIHVKPHVPLTPSRIMVWNEANARLFKEFNPWMRQASLAVSGSLHLAPFLISANILPKETFYQETGLDPHRPFLCYTAASPRAVVEEEKVVGWVLEAIEEGKLPNRPQVLLRVNPMEDGSRFATLAKKYPSDLILQRPRWEWFPEADWCCALPEDVKLWVSTVHYATLNVSIPSTVTLEFACLGKPVVNICFDATSDIPAETSNRRFWQGDFYREIREMDLAAPSFSAEELLSNLNRLMGNAAQTASQSSQNLEWLTYNAVDRVMAGINELWP